MTTFATQLKITLDDLTTIRTALNSGVIVASPDGARFAVTGMIDDVMMALINHRSDIERLSPRQKATKLRQLRRVLGYTYP